MIKCEFQNKITLEEHDEMHLSQSTFVLKMLRQRIHVSEKFSVENKRIN